MNYSPYGSLELGGLPSGSQSPDSAGKRTYQYHTLSNGAEQTNFGENSTPDAISPNTFTPALTLQRRWSLLDQLDDRHYCRVRSCADCARIINCKCILATCMLATFIVLALTFAHVLFFATNEVGFVRFDYIIVGSSPAGVLIAHDLVKSGAKVLLIEAGNATQFELGGQDYFAGPISRFDIPYIWPSLLSYEQFHWPGYEDNSHVSLAKGLGGAGVLGPMTYLRAQPSDIESWNVSSLQWPRMLELYKSLEWFRTLQTNTSSEASTVPAFHGNHGAIVTSEVELDALGSLFINASSSAGIGFPTADFNDPSCNRVNVTGTFHVNVFGGTRDSAALRFLRPILGETNFVLETEATATRILLTTTDQRDAPFSSRPSKQRAYGVQFIQKGVVRTAYLRMQLPQSMQKQIFSAPRGVLISADSINSAKLLINSGIGPADQLSDPDSKPIISEGVGRHLQDHVTIGLLVGIDASLAAMTTPFAADVLSELPGYISSVQHARNKLTKSNSSRSDIADYGTFGTTGVTTGAFLRSPFSQEGEESGPDLQLTVHPRPIDPFFSMYKREKERLDNTEINGNTKASVVAADGLSTLTKRAASAIPSETSPLMLITITLLKRDGYQRVILQDNNPSSVPLIVQENLESEKNRLGVGRLSDRDLARLRWGLRRVRAILSTPPLKKWIKDEALPGPKFNSDDQLSSWIDLHVVPANQWTGTCRMGSPADPTAVVDDEFRVYEVQDLRVVGAAVMPRIVGGDIRATELALAQYASQVILSHTTD